MRAKPNVCQPQTSPWPLQLLVSKQWEQNNVDDSKMRQLKGSYLGQWTGVRTRLLFGCDTYVCTIITKGTLAHFTD